MSHYDAFPIMRRPTVKYPLCVRCGSERCATFTRHFLAGARVMLCETCVAAVDAQTKIIDRLDPS